MCCAHVVEAVGSEEPLVAMAVGTHNRTGQMVEAEKHEG